MDSVRVLEFYSGIGGMHCSLEAAGIPYTVVAAFDINTLANEVYKHNFGEKCLKQRNLMSLTSAELDGYAADLWTMSPPCQPFTRQGKQNDLQDSRTDSFMHLMQVFEGCTRKPSFLLLENVFGFEKSQTRQRFVNILHQFGYSLEEYLLNPVDYGIPNSRLRYYLLAKKKSTEILAEIGEFSIATEPLTSPKPCFDTQKCQVCTKTCGQSLKKYLDSNLGEIEEKFLLPASILENAGQAQVLDIVCPNSVRSCCFTRAYAHYVCGTGSVLYPGDSLEKVTEAYSILDEKARITAIKSLKLRYFTAREIANFMCFPQNFGFPESLTHKQCCRVLGNSINVEVLAHLMRRLLRSS